MTTPPTEAEVCPTCGATPITVVHYSRRHICPTAPLTVEALAEALAYVAHDLRLCKSSDFWHLLAHAEANEPEDVVQRNDFAAAILAAIRDTEGGA